MYEKPARACGLFVTQRTAGSQDPVSWYCSCISTNRGAEIGSGDLS